MDVQTAEKLGVVGLLLSAIVYLLREKKNLISHIATKDERERRLRDKRTEELLETASLLAESSTVVKDALADVDRSLNDLKREVERCRKDP